MTNSDSGSKKHSRSIVSEEILQAQQKISLVALVLDYQKAFGTVNHSVLLEILLNYDKRGKCL